MPIPKTPVNIRASGQRLTAHGMLLDAIVAGEFEPGERLYDEALEERFGTTRSAIRAALFELETQWMVRIVPRRGTFVTEFDFNRGIQAAEVLAGITMRAMQDSAGNLTQDDLNQLSAYRERWLRAPDTMHEALLTSQEDDGLYGIFYTACGNPELARVRDWVVPYVKRLRRHLVDAGEINANTAMTLQREVIAEVLQGQVEKAATRLWEGTEPLFGEYDNQVLTVEPPKPGIALARDLVADTIERAIIDGTLVPGEPLPESDLMAWLGVSHTPVRQALDALANRGLVEQQLNRSARVATLDETTIRHAFAAYGVLIFVGARRAMRLDRKKLLAALKPHHDRFLREPSTPVTEVNAGINLALFEFSGAQVLAELSERMASRLTWRVIGNDANMRPGAIRLAAESRAAIAANDIEAMERVEREAYEVNSFL